MNGNSILIGRVFGIPIRVHILLVVLLPVLAMLYSDSLALGLLLVVGVFASVAMHELGHSVVAMRKGCHVQEIVLTPIGGMARMSRIPSKPADEFQVAIAGPLVSLALGLAGFFSRQPVLFVLGAINLFLFGFNLLPCFPMDGGRVLRAGLATRMGRAEATRIAVQVGKYFCIFFVVFGLLRMRLLLAFIGFYIWQAGQMEYRMVLLEQQAERFSGYRDGQLDVQVGPPPYAGGEGIAQRLRHLFRR